jgi:hypothetical protein
MTVQWDATHQNLNPSVRAFSRNLPTIYRLCALSGKRCFRQQRGANGDFGNLQICRVLRTSEVVIGVGFAHVFQMGECACML